MDAIAHLPFLKIAPRKVRAIVDVVRGKPAGEAIQILKFMPKSAAAPVCKLIQSAVANATDLSKGAVDIDKLFIKTITVDQGPTGRRFMPRAMGRATPINKKTSHVRVTVSDAR